jgi:hypothetical protein
MVGVGVWITPVGEMTTGAAASAGDAGARDATQIATTASAMAMATCTPAFLVARDDLMVTPLLVV